MIAQTDEHAGLVHVDANELADRHEGKFFLEEYALTVLEHLQALVNLQTLSLAGTRVTEAGTEKLNRALPNCRIYH